MHQGPFSQSASQAHAGPGMSRVAAGCLLALCTILAAQIMLLAPHEDFSGQAGGVGDRGNLQTKGLMRRGLGRHLWQTSEVSRTLKQRSSSGRALVVLRERMAKELLAAVAPAQSPIEATLAPSPASYGHADSTPVPAASLGAPLPAPEAQASTVPPAAVAPAPRPSKDATPPSEAVSPPKAVVQDTLPPKAVVQDTLPPQAEAAKPPPRKNKSPPPSAPPPRKAVAGVAPQAQAPQAKAAEPKEAPAPQPQAKAPTGGNKEAQGNPPLGSDALGDGRGGQGAPASMQFSPPRPPWPPFPSSPPPNPPSPPPAAPPAPAPSPFGVAPPSSESSPVSTGLIVAAVVGGGALLLALTALGFFCYYMAAKRRQGELSPLSAVASDSKMAGNLSNFSPSSYGTHTPSYGIPGTASAASIPGYPYASSGMPDSGAASAMGGAMAGALAGGALAAGASGASLAMLSSPGGRSTHSQVSQGQSWFSYEELEAATGGFAMSNKLGEGGFGKVYKGVMPDGRVVAVKALTLGGGQGEREFRAEVEIISRVHHRYLVTLLGYCIARDQRLLVYEYVPNGTLESALHGKGRPVMSWSLRMKCAIGAAKGLAYLHEDCHPRIIHRDIKSSNILLDAQHEAQVADFGLAKLAADNTTHVSTRVMGTFGYLAPEYAMSGKLTDKSDVFSFGVVLLELISGRRPVDPTQAPGKESLVEWARPLLAGNEISLLVDPRLEGRYDDAEMERMVATAALCVRHSSGLRPRMGQVVRMLEGAAEMPHAGAPPGMSMMMYEGSPFGGPTQNFDSALYSAEMRQQYPNGTATPSPASSYGAPRVGTGRSSSLGRAAEYSPSRQLASDVDIMGPGAYDMHMGMANIDRVSSAHGSARDTRGMDMESMSTEDSNLAQNRTDSNNSLPLPPGRMAPVLPTPGVPQEHLDRPQLGGWSAGKPIPEGESGGEEDDVEPYAHGGDQSGFLGYGNGQSTGFDQLGPHFSTTSGVSDANWSVQVSEKLREGR